MNDDLRTAICPGSYDPVTLGHLDIIKRAAQIFDRVVVGVVREPSHKQTMFSVEERVGFLEEALRDQDNVEVDVFSELVVEFAKRWGAKTMVKGLRVISDFEWEFQMNHLNRTLAPDVETVYLMSNPQYSFVSSSGVKEVASFGGSVDELVPEPSRAASRRCSRTASPARPVSPRNDQAHREPVPLRRARRSRRYRCAVAVGIAVARDDDSEPRCPGGSPSGTGAASRTSGRTGPTSGALPLRRLGRGQLSWNGGKLAWDTSEPRGSVGNARRPSGESISAPLGANFARASPRTERERRFLHSRDDGRYDIWVGRPGGARDAEQVTNTRNVSDVSWSPKGTGSHTCRTGPDETLEGQISLVRPSGDDATRSSSRAMRRRGRRTASTWCTSTTGHLDDRHRRHRPKVSRPGTATRRPGRATASRSRSCARSAARRRSARSAYSSFPRPERRAPGRSDVLRGADRIIWLPDP